VAFEIEIALLWVLAASIVGLGISALFAGNMELRRRIFLFPYVIIASIFLGMFFYWNSVDIVQLITTNWLYGIIAGVVIGALLALKVLSGNSDQRTIDRELAIDITWIGLVYGLLDALFLNIMPVIAIWNAFDRLGFPASWIDQLLIGILALGASLLVTLFYHLGYPEFRNRTMGLVLFGNSLITLAYLVSTNPFGALLSHTLMHIAAAVKGPETTIQLPPHYA
jgi:hypothetical protein